MEPHQHPRRHICIYKDKALIQDYLYVSNVNNIITLNGSIKVDKITIRNKKQKELFFSAFTNENETTLTIKTLDEFSDVPEEVQISYFTESIYWNAYTEVIFDPENTKINVRAIIYNTGKCEKGKFLLAADPPDIKEKSEVLTYELKIDEISSNISIPLSSYVADLKKIYLINVDTKQIYYGYRVEGELNIPSKKVKIFINQEDDLRNCIGAGTIKMRNSGYDIIVGNTDRLTVNFSNGKADIKKLVESTLSVQFYNSNGLMGKVIELANEKTTHAVTN
jgi:hypothetical protein